MSLTEVAHAVAPGRTGADAFDLFGAPPLLAAEDRSAYDRLLTRIAGDLDPQDTLEMMWVRDLADLVWETLRYRRFRSLIVDAARHEALGALARSLAAVPRDGEPSDRHRLNDHAGGRWMSDAAAKSEVLQILGAHGMVEETITAEAFRRRGEDIERIEKLLISAEIRRDGVLREIGAYRDGFAARARASVNRIVDAEPLAIEAAPAEPVCPS